MVKASKCRVNTGGRECADCRRYLPWDMFPAKNGGVGGKQSYCRECWSIRKSEYNKHATEEQKSRWADAENKKRKPKPRQLGVLIRKFVNMCKDTKENSKITYIKKCQVCGKEFTTNLSRRVNCSFKCRDMIKRKNSMVYGYDAKKRKTARERFKEVLKNREKEYNRLMKIYNEAMKRKEKAFIEYNSYINNIRNITEDNQGKTCWRCFLFKPLDCFAFRPWPKSLKIRRLDCFCQECFNETPSNIERNKIRERVNVTLKKYIDGGVPKVVRFTGENKSDVQKYQQRIDSIRNRHRRRAAVRGTPYGDWVKELKTHATFKCYWCGKTVSTASLHIDHIIPLWHGGVDGRENVCASCAPCNLSKGHMPYEDWAKKIGRLAI